MAIAYAQHGQVCIMEIDRPGQANSIDLNTAREMAELLDRVAEDPEIRAIVLTGGGDRVFCAGMDLGAVRDGHAAAINGLPGGFAGLVRRELPQPVIAAVNGAAMGGGFELVLACDLAIAANTARFALPEVEHGLIAASGGLVRLPRRLPAPLAVELLLTGAPVSAARALELGLVNRVVAADRLRVEALELAELIADRDPRAVRASLRIARAVARRGEADAWRLSDELAAALSATHEGAAA